MSRKLNPLPPNTQFLEPEEAPAPGAPEMGRVVGNPVKMVPGPRIAPRAETQDKEESFFAPEASGQTNLVTREQFLAKLPLPPNSWLPKHLQTPAERLANANRPEPKFTGH